MVSLRQARISERVVSSLFADFPLAKILYSAVGILPSLSADAPLGKKRREMTVSSCKAGMAFVSQESVQHDASQQVLSGLTLLRFYPVTMV